MILFSYFILLFGLTTAIFNENTFGLRLTTEKPKTLGNTQYSFQYYVKDDVTGDYKIQEETRKGDSVQGSYTIADPNGDLRTVKYTAGPGRGFEATVNVQPSASPMFTNKQFKRTSTTAVKNSMRTEKPDTVKSTIKQYTNGFGVDISSKTKSDLRSKMALRVTVNTTEETPKKDEVENTSENFNTSTETIKTTEQVNASALQTTNIPDNASLEEATEILDDLENLNTNSTVDDVSGEVEVEATEDPTEGRDISEDPDLYMVPKFQDFLTPENDTNFRNRKDPEEISLDERINQIARQLAETSIRREYEERKLGHIIPISLRPIERSTSGYLSKAVKFTNDEISQIGPSDLPNQVVTQIGLIPQYIYRDSFPTFSHTNQKLPVYTKPENDKVYYETLTIPQEAGQSSILNTKYEEVPNQHIPIIQPIHVPAVVHFFTPLQRFFVNPQITTEEKTEPFDNTKNAVSEDDSIFTYKSDDSNTN